MPTIEFYIISNNLLYSTCTLIEKIYSSLQKQDKVVIYCENTELATQLDLELWGFKPTAFIPHTIKDSAAPIIISTCDNSIPNANICIDLSNTIPAAWQKFNYLIEVIDGTKDKVKKIHREHYRSYKNANANIETKFID